MRCATLRDTLTNALWEIADSVTVVLVRPVRAENVGAACRALKNMGFASLRLVEPAPDCGAPATRNAAYGAWDVIDGARRFGSLRDAIADVHFVVATSGRVRPDRSLDVRSLGALVGERARCGQRTALVFGSEASGLPDSELDQCHVTIHVPTDASQPSLNLAQAVLLSCWEIRRSTLDSPATPELAGTSGETSCAPTGGMEACLDDVRSSLLSVGYLNQQNPDLILAEIRRLLARSRPTPRELSLLRGIARQVRWAGQNRRMP